MTLKFLDLYNECAGQPWSMYDNDAENIEDLESALKMSINKAASYLWNLYPWTFRVRTQKLKTKVDRAKYTMPNGQLTKKVLSGQQYYGVKYNGEYLLYEPDYEFLDDKETLENRKPTSFYPNNEDIYIYPAPDDVYTIDLEYLLLPYGLNIEDEEIYELKEEEDYINIPEKYETLFKNCLISKAMMYAIADETDENYSGYVAQYEDALNTLIKYCANRVVDRYIGW